MISKTTDTEECQIGDMRHFKSSDFIQIDPPSESMIEMWRDLFRESRGHPDDTSGDPLSAAERKLYETLTARMSDLFALIGMTVTEIDEPNKDEPGSRAVTY